MGIFSPVKKNANKFRYVPRYYDPEKERRDQRRKELCGTSSHDEGEYVPGQYIRTQREARRAAKANSQSKGKRPSAMLFILAGLAIMAIILYPRLVSLSHSKQKRVARQPDEMAEYKQEQMKTTSGEEYKKAREEWQEAMERVAWPYQEVKSITIVPNDSKEGM